MRGNRKKRGKGEGKGKKRGREGALVIHANGLRFVYHHRFSLSYLPFLSCLWMVFLDFI
jgi:hypothetical protein